MRGWESEKKRTMKMKRKKKKSNGSWDGREATWAGFNSCNVLCMVKKGRTVQMDMLKRSTSGLLIGQREAKGGDSEDTGRTAWRSNRLLLVE